MNPDAKRTVAVKSKEQAQFYFQTGNYGRAFAHFLVALKLMPEWKTALKFEFSRTLCAWSGQLESQQRFKDMFDCYEQAIEIFPENEEVFCNLGAHLFRLGHLCEAAHYFRQTLEINYNYLPAYRNLQSVCNKLIERWHFRMLNDSHRNEAYREAILKKIRQGFTSVLDIGTGTGLLSLYAATGGAKDVHACDYSPTMCSIALKVFHANNMADNVKLVNKLSNNLTIPEDFPQKKSLVVTETMDCGLLGEHLLQTLIHAWEKLLRPACSDLLTTLDSEAPSTLTQHGVVLPFGARLWLVPIQSSSIARSSYILDTYHSSWNFTNIWLFSATNEPYDTENLRKVKDCKFLSDPVQIFSFDFNNPLQLKAYYNGDYDGKCVSFCYEGKCDALAVWFDIVLDEDITISSSPFSSNKECCWDQAIFRFKKPQESVKVKVKCKGGKLDFESIAETSSSLFGGDQNFLTLCSNSSRTRNSQEIAISAEAIRFINNTELKDVIQSLPDHLNEVKNVLDLSPFPLLGLRFLQCKGVNLVCVLKTIQEVIVLQEFVKYNNLDIAKLKCIMKSEFEDLIASCCEQFDYVINNVFEPTGELHEYNINIIPKLLKMLTPDGMLAPVKLTVMCQLIDCEWISQTSRVLDKELSQTYRIAEFINIYQVSQQLDVDLRNISYTGLSSVTACLQLSHSDLATDSYRSEEMTVTAVQDGCVTAVSLWYQYQLCVDGTQLSTFSDTSHINQAVFVVDQLLHVKSGDAIAINVTYQSGIVRLKVLS